MVPCGSYKDSDAEELNKNQKCSQLHISSSEGVDGQKLLRLYADFNTENNAHAPSKRLSTPQALEAGSIHVLLMVLTPASMLGMMIVSGKRIVAIMKADG